ncbi:hypothetical protein ACFSTA_05390 [Ornithinibacillus salinisoli]|uniref:Peptidyl-prolyl cis-trans isomerase n=2 Tax=Ornithinibacillus salinisoli TaxID=1848459 RepID=A0ABW4VWF0_9BACI
MIVPIIGNVTYSITMDPTVWIFDDRKILLHEAFSSNKQPIDNNEDDIEKAAKRWENEVFHHKINPPVNKSISRLEGKKILTESYVMPIKDFINHAEVKPEAKEAKLITRDGDIILSLSDLMDAYLFFAREGKPLKEDGPVHLMYQDGSNKDNPIKGIKKIEVL